MNIVQRFYEKVNETEAGKIPVRNVNIEILSSLLISMAMTDTYEARLEYHQMIKEELLAFGIDISKKLEKPLVVVMKKLKSYGKNNE